MQNNIHRRIAVSFISTVIRGGIAFITGLLIARLLGPNEYGRMAFLLASFLAFKQLLDMGSSSAFFTFIARRTRSRKFYTHYFIWIGIQILFPIVLISMLISDNLLHLFWKGETRDLVLMAMIAVLMQHVLWVAVSQMVEAKRGTVYIQLLSLLVGAFHLIFILILWRFNLLSISSIFIGIAVEWVLASWALMKVFPMVSVGNIALSESKKTEAFFGILKEFYQYCLPIIPYAWLGFACNFLDYWMLQHWGGSSEQAYYGVAMQFASVALIATTSIVNIFWKEIAEAHENKDFYRLKNLYWKTLKALYFLGSIMVGGLLPWVSEIIIYLLGHAYIDGATTLMILLLYPVHQSIGQISSSILYATGRTRVQSLLGMIYMVASIFVTYLFIAPNTSLIPGLDLGSIGLACKMVILQVIIVNVTSWYACQIIHEKFEWTYQITTLGIAILVGWACKILVTSISDENFYIMLISVIMYLLVMIFIFLMAPCIAGITRSEVSRALTFLWKYKWN